MVSMKLFARCHQRSVLIALQNYRSLSSTTPVTYAEDQEFDVSSNNSTDENLKSSENASRSQQLIREIRSVRHEHHSIVLVQPRVKAPWLRPANTNYALAIQEAVTLATTLPGWSVSDVVKLGVHFSTKRPALFGTGQIANLAALIRAKPTVSAVFVNVSMLTGSQFFEIARSVGMPVFDRYSVILLIFKHFAKTQEARLQISLAELPYLRERLRELKHPQDLMLMDTIGLEKYGGIQTYWQNRKELIDSHELKLKKELARVRKNRAIEKTRLERVHKLPLIAVIGYTNSGKTSLIRRLTHDLSAVPQNRLFATLDVTTHHAMLNRRTRAMLMDTVGFIADIPSTLISSFSATLDDIRQADLLIHVRDISHPDKRLQADNVHETLKSMNLPDHLLANMLELWNKVDLLSSKPDSDTSPEHIEKDRFDSLSNEAPIVINPDLSPSDREDETVRNLSDGLEDTGSNGSPGWAVSCYTKYGLDKFVEALESRVFEVCGFSQHTFLLPIGSPAYDLLAQCASIEHTVCTPDGAMTFVLVSMSARSYQIFRGRHPEVKEVKR